MTTQYASPVSSVDYSTLDALEAVLAEMKEQLKIKEELKEKKADGEVGDSSSAAASVPLDEEREDAAEVLTSEAGSNIVVKRKDFNHRGSDWNPLTAREGTDTFQFTVPPGYEFSHHEITPLKTTFPHELKLVAAPAKGSTASASLRVRWKLWGLGQVNYQMSAFCHRQGTAAPRPQVIVGTPGWDSRAAQLIAQKQSFRLVLSGPDAQRLWDSLKFFTDNDREVEPTVTITLAVITGVIALAGFATLAYVLTLAINEKCDTKANFNLAQLLAGITFDIGCR